VGIETPRAPWNSKCWNLLIVWGHSIHDLSSFLSERQVFQRTTLSGGFFKFSNVSSMLDSCQFGWSGVRECANCMHLNPELMMQMIPMTVIYVCFNGVYTNVGWVFDFVNNLLSPFISKPSKNWWLSLKNQQWTSGLWKDVWWFFRTMVNISETFRPVVMKLESHALRTSGSDLCHF
jgi:hypothetical protein